MHEADGYARKLGPVSEGYGLAVTGEGVGVYVTDEGYGLGVTGTDEGWRD